MKISKNNYSSNTDFGNKKLLTACFNPYRNENVAALELQYCGSRAAIKF